jgi:pyruvate dehydrogenase E1 component beta subunit
MSEHRTETYQQALAAAMDCAVAQHPEVIIIGQGVDDHKGIFGTTIGIPEKYGRDRCFDVPLAEESMAGVAIGAALNGLYPIQTHIRADFALLAMNQYINLAAKYRYMFAGKFEVPMLVRLVVGRSWGQGAQHSQSLQALFAHIPGLTVIMPTHPHTIRHSYAYAVENWRNPVISIEHRLMYNLEFNLGAYPEDEVKRNPFSSYKIRDGKDVTIVSTSIMTLEALRAAEHLSRVAGIDCTIIDLHCATHANWELIFESVRDTGKLLVADTSWRAYGVCAEVCRRLVERAPAVLKEPAVTVGMADAPCPTAKTLEDMYYPNLSTLSDSIAQLVTGKKDHGITLPCEKSMTDVYKHFKGPF